MNIPAENKNLYKVKRRPLASKGLIVLNFKNYLKQYFHVYFEPAHPAEV